MEFPKTVTVSGLRTVTLNGLVTAAGLACITNMVCIGTAKLIQNLTIDDVPGAAVLLALEVEGVGGVDALLDALLVDVGLGRDLLVDVGLGGNVLVDVGLGGGVVAAAAVDLLLLKKI